MQFTVTAARGMEHLTARELNVFSAQNIQIDSGAVHASGSLETLYRVCLWCRTGLHVLLPLTQFEITSEHDLYNKLREFEWHNYLRSDQSFVIDFNAIESCITHKQYGAQRTKDAIVDYFRERDGVRPSVDKDRPDVRFSLFINKNEVTLAFDLSGDSLHRRGYRIVAGPAPLKETLAAALLLRGNWFEISKRGGGFIDPLCGTGTLLIEAAMIAADIAPGLARSYFGFFGWNKHDPDLWLSLLKEARARRKEGLKHLGKIIGFDRDRSSIALAERSIRLLGLESAIEIRESDLLNLTWPHDLPDTGLVLTNPPYGERLGTEFESQQAHQALGRFFLLTPARWKTMIFTHIDGVAPLFDLSIENQYPFMNGPLVCRLVNYQKTGNSKGDADASIPAKRAEGLINRLRKNEAHLKKWRTKNNIDCYRLYDADLPEFAAVIDCYGDYFHVQEYAPPLEIPADKAGFRRLLLMNALCDVFETTPNKIVLKTRQRQRGKQQYDKQEADDQIEFVVQENGLKFYVNLTEYLDSGLFLDHRTTREKVRQLAKGKRVLNLFCYTGSVSVYAAAGSAAAIDSVDLSNTYLDWCEDNFHLNKLSSPHYRFIQADCLRFIESEPSGGYDLIFLDPPTFSNSKSMETTLDIQRDHIELITHCLRLLAPRGQLIFSTNRHRFKLDEEALHPLADIESWTHQTTDKDFVRKPAHQCWLLKPRVEHR